ncbi:MAG: hypothetical protein SWQ30_17315 [Thermodesulfobacteriota bacterium]|nr:hypothetical protein [Thermodesulfobacteriota bacterium]
MKRGLGKLSLFALLFVIAMIVITNIALSRTAIHVQISPGADLSKYEDVYIDVQNDDYGTLEKRRHGKGVSWVRQEIRGSLEQIGFRDWAFDQISRVPGNKDMLLNCHITFGLGRPRIIRHFRVLFRFVKTIDLGFLDARRGEVIAEVSYVRAFWDNETKDAVDEMFKQLKTELKVAKEKEMVQTSANE